MKKVRLGMIGYGFRGSGLLGMARSVPQLEPVPMAPLDYAMLSDFVKAINGESCELDLRQGLRMTLPGLAALESSAHGGRVTEIKYPW